MSTILAQSLRVTRALDAAGTWLPGLVLRALVGWEFLEAGLMKLHGENWFAGIQGDFPFPFNALPPDLNWALATWTELLGGVALWLGLGTRLWALALAVLTMVAIAAVHWPAEWHTLADLWRGYAISEDGYGNYKLPLILLVMLLPLLFSGPGRASLDAWIAAAARRRLAAPRLSAA